MTRLLLRARFGTMCGTVAASAWLALGAGVGRAADPPPSTAETTAQINAEIQGIVELSRASEFADTRCRAFLDTVQAKVRDSERTEYFTSRSSALAALHSVNEYPGTPGASAEAWEAFLFLPSLPTGKDATELRLALARLSHCHSVEFYGVLTRLIDPRTRRQFSSSEQGELRRNLISYLCRESDGGPRLFLQMEEWVALLDQSVRTRLLPASLETQAAIADLQWGMRKLKQENAERFRRLEEATEPASGLLIDTQWQLARADDFRMGAQDALEMELDDLSAFRPPTAGPVRRP